MKKPKVAAKKTRSLAKGLIAGCIGGIVGTLARTFAERMLLSQAHAELPEPDAAAPAGQALVPVTKAAAPDEIRWALGAAAGAAYGAVAEYFPAATAKEGASFGIALGVLTRETPMPAVGRAAKSTKSTDAAGDVPPLVVYGLTTEFVRKWVRKVL
jgi:putative membrane protein